MGANDVTIHGYPPVESATAGHKRYQFNQPPALCYECGVKVLDFDMHDGFHNWLQTIAANARRAGQDHD